jgi:hypothetical protein
MLVWRANEDFMGVMDKQNHCLAIYHHFALRVDSFKGYEKTSWSVTCGALGILRGESKNVEQGKIDAIRALHDKLIEIDTPLKEYLKLETLEERVRLSDDQKSISMGCRVGVGK